jgi:hypothetical protein
MKSTLFSVLAGYAAGKDIPKEHCDVAMQLIPHIQKHSPLF